MRKVRIIILLKRAVLLRNGAEDVLKLTSESLSEQAVTITALIRRPGVPALVIKTDRTSVHETE